MRNSAEAKVGTGPAARGQPGGSGGVRHRRPLGCSARIPNRLGRPERHRALDDRHPAGGVEPGLGPDDRSDGGGRPGAVEAHEIGARWPSRPPRRPWPASVRRRTARRHRCPSGARSPPARTRDGPTRPSSTSTASMTSAAFGYVSVGSELSSAMRSRASSGSSTNPGISVEPSPGAEARSHGVQTSERPLVADELAALRPRVPQRQRGDVRRGRRRPGRRAWHPVAGPTRCSWSAPASRGSPDPGRCWRSRRRVGRDRWASRPSPRCRRSRSAARRSRLSASATASRR